MPSHTTTRVELHGAVSSADYEALHTAMASQGFSRTIRGSDGFRYQLPTAMYYFLCPDHLSIENVRDNASAAASSVWKQGHEVFVTLGPSAWRGLPKV